jgi:hypothetical protein
MVFGRAENVNLGRLTAPGFSPMLAIGNVRQSVPCLACAEKRPLKKRPPPPPADNLEREVVVVGLPGDETRAGVPGRWGERLAEFLVGD